MNTLKQTILNILDGMPEAWDYIGDELRSDKEFILSAVKQDGHALCCADERLKKDKEVAIAAVKQNGRTLQYADESLKKDKTIVLAIAYNVR